MAATDDSGTKWEVQLRKGSLDLVILAALRGRCLYGLELLGLMQGFDSFAISEGTLYPLLDRLRRDGVVDAHWKQEGESKPRKYYQLTPLGERRLADFTQRWRNGVADIEHLLSHPGPAPLNRRVQAR
ncbi:PadR family transcriptional regulator [Pseudomarimonas arenosa]|nr:PadR family transcriptional regulator [Pseudomarimonas arenosa]